jgi:hypothetical protein
MLLDIFFEGVDKMESTEVQIDAGFQIVTPGTFWMFTVQTYTP